MIAWNRFQNTEQFSEIIQRIGPAVERLRGWPN